MKQTKGAAGLVGWSVGANLANLEFYTLSAWEDEQSLRGFMMAEPHGEALRSFHGDLRRASIVVSFPVFGKDLPLGWKDAIARQKAEDGVTG